MFRGFKLTSPPPNSRNQTPQLQLHSWERNPKKRAWIASLRIIVPQGGGLQLAHGTSLFF